MAVAASLSLLPSTLSPKLFNSSSAQFQPKAGIPLFRMQNAAVLTSSAAVGVGEDLPHDYGEVFPLPDPSERRRAGVLLHPTSFRGPHGIGDLGEEAFRFIDWLHDAGCSLWQVLPLVPPGRKANEEGSPYSGQVFMFTQLGLGNHNNFNHKKQKYLNQVNYF